MGNGMNSWVVWGVFAIVVVLLGWVGYHFTVRTLRFMTLAFVVAVVVLVTRYGVTHLSPATPAAPADLVNAFTRGLDDLSGAFFQPLLPGPDVLEPGRVGWLVIIAFLAFAYRELEVWAMRWQPPTVDTSALGGDKPGTQKSSAPGDDEADRQRWQDELVAELRFRLPAVEVRAPPAIPPEEGGEDITYGLRKELLTAAGDELRACRRQLTLRRVIWATFRHRDERAVRKPYWRLRERQRFGDGVRVAELLVAVRQKLNKPEPGCNDGQPAKKYRHARTALHITAAITGDSATIKEVLKNRKMPDSPIPLPKEWHPGSYVGETRWLPWQGRTPSWQTAYNTACLFAALACNYSDPENEMAHRAVESLRSAVGDRHCEMERPSDWISKDPDLCCLKSSEFTKFLKKQTKKDYPPANPEPDHHRHLAHRDGARAGLAEVTETGNFQQQQSRP